MVVVLWRRLGEPGRDVPKGSIETREELPEVIVTGTRHASLPSDESETAEEWPALSRTDLACDPGLEDPPPLPEQSEVLVEEIRRLYASDTVFPFLRVEDRVRRRLGAKHTSPEAALIRGSVGIGLRLAVALLATAVAGEWADVPWARWAVVLVVYGLFDATAPWRTPPLDETPTPASKRMVDDWTALLPTIPRESDLEELTAFTRRWIRLSVAAVMGMLVTTTLFIAAWFWTPTGLSELPVGTTVILAFILFDFGAIIVTPYEWPLMAHEAAYEHRLFWASPADSPEVARALRMSTGFGFATGAWITIWLILAMILLPWGSPVLIPVAVGFIVLGYLTTISTTLGVRAGIKRIVRETRNRQMTLLQRRIDTFGSRSAELSTRELEEVQALIDLHRTIRDGPTTPASTHPLIRTAAGLVIPTIMFVITIFGEVSAERFLDALLP